jgi:hypothetical protein
MITAPELLASPAWLPLHLLPDGALHLVRLEEAAYRAASFLDQRLLQPGTPQARAEIATVQGAAARLGPAAHFIFHTGHAGSTLVSRLLGEHPDLFSLREPALLRPLADTAAAAGGRTLELPQAIALLSRTWRPGQRALIKATSFVSERAQDLLDLDRSAVALLICTSPLSYLRGILAGPNSRIESRTLAPRRQARLATRLGDGRWQPDPVSEGEQVAMSWLCEMSALTLSAQRHPGRVRWVNFDAFLASPAPALAGMLQVLGVTAPAAELERLVRGPLMRQYSKAPEHAYDAELRRQVLLSADQEHGREIRRGMAWLEHLAQAHALVREALAAAQAA